MGFDEIDEALGTLAYGPVQINVSVQGTFVRNHFFPG